MRRFGRDNERPSIQDISKTGNDGIKRHRYQIVREWHQEIQSNITGAREKLNNLDSLDPESKIRYGNFLTVIEERARANLAEARRGYYTRFTAPFTTDQGGHNKRANASVVLEALVPKSREILDILQRSDIEALVPKSQEILDILRISNIEEGRGYLQQLQQLARLKQVNQEMLPRIREGLVNLERQGIPDLLPAAEVNLQHQKVMRELVPHADVSNALKPYRDMSDENLAQERHNAEQRRAELSRERRDLLMKNVKTDDDEKRLNVIEEEQDNIANKITDLAVERSIRKAIPDLHARENARALRDRRLTVIEAIKQTSDAIKQIDEELSDKVIGSVFKEQLDNTRAAAKELLTIAYKLMPKLLGRLKSEVFETARQNFLDQIPVDSLEQPTKLDERSAARDLFAQWVSSDGGLVFDVDETLIDRTRGREAWMTMPKGFIESAERLVNAGIPVAIITGRTTEFVIQNLQLGGATQDLIDRIDIYGEYGITHKGPDTNGKIIRLNKDTTGIELSKGAAVASLVTRLGLKNVVVFGDDIPDLAMNKALRQFIAGNQHVYGYLSDRENRRELLEKSISRPTAQDETFAPTEDQIQTRIQFNEEFLSLYKSTLESQAFVGVKHPEGWPLSTEAAIIEASTFMLENPDDTVAFITEMTDKITAPSELKRAIKTVDAKLKKVINDPYLAAHTDVSNCQRTLEATISYLESGEVTTEDLREKLKALEVDNARVDDRIEDRIREEVNKCSEEAKDIKRFQPEPFKFRNFKIGDILDFPQLAEDFQDASELQKQPEKIYRVLQPLQREPEAIDKLNTEYRKKYQKTLETALRERFDESEDHARLEYALQLINKGKSEAEQAIRPILALDEPQHISERFNQTLKGVSTRINQALEGNQPEDVCTELTAFERNPYLVSQLEEAYQEEFGTDLYSAIGQKLQGESSQRVQGLMGDQAWEKQVVSQNGARRLEKMLLINLEIPNVARRINQALRNGHPETVYAALTPFERNTDPLCKLAEAYQKEYGTDLLSAIGENPYARYLMGDEVWEKVVRSLKEVVALQKALLELAFDRDDGMSVLVPYGGDSEPGVHIKCQVLKGMGYKSKKFFAHSLRTDEYGWKHPNLHARTNFAPDMPPGQEPTIAWNSRVAPLIEVETPFGVRELVLGSSDRASSVEDWVGTMSQDPFERISLDAYKAKLDVGADLNPDFPNPADKTYVFTASRNCFYLPTSGAIAYLQSLETQPDNKTIADFSARETYNDSGKRMIIDGEAAWMPYSGIARFIRENMQSIRDDASAERFLNAMATDFVKNANTFHPRSTVEFTSDFPNLYDKLLAHMAERNVSFLMAKRFERLLSGDYAPSEIKVDQSTFFDRSIYNIENNNIFLQPPGPKLANAESQFHEGTDPWLLEMISSNAMGAEEIRKLKDAFACSQDPDVMKKSLSEDEFHSFFNDLGGIRQEFTARALLVGSVDQVKGFRDPDADDVSSQEYEAEKPDHLNESRLEGPSSLGDQRSQTTLPQIIEKIQQIDALVEKSKKRIIRDILEISSVTMEYVNFYRVNHKDTVNQVGKYFNICVDKLQDGISEVEECDNEGSNYDVFSQKVNNLMNINKETRKAMNIIDFREKFPTIDKIIQEYDINIPVDLKENHKVLSDQYWRGVARKSAESEGKQLTDEAFEIYYQDVCREMDQKIQNLFENTEIWMRRHPHALRKTLESRCGRFTTSLNSRFEEGEWNIFHERRDKSEKAIHGYPEDTPMEWRILYTYPTEDRNGKSSSALDIFGAVAIHFKPEVKQRSTTLLSGLPLITDGLTYIDGRSVPYYEANRDCFPISWEYMKEDDLSTGFRRRTDFSFSGESWKACQMRYDDPRDLNSIDEVSPYPEVHVHGGLTIDDIEEVVFPEAIHQDTMKTLTDLLDKYNIKWRSYP